MGSDLASCTIVLSREHNRARNEDLTPGSLLPTNPLTDAHHTRLRRLTSIDTLRGIVMILMALDHARDFFGVPARVRRTSQTTVPLFLTRWITHICAPTFFLLTGTGAVFALPQVAHRNLSRFLVTRGLWLMVLEFTLIRCLGHQFNFDYQVTLLLVIWALGWSMVVLRLMVLLPVPAILDYRRCADCRS